ncbi:hypothetical protein FQN50_006887 [Emmonsiellopsis sp. PD_5]|nr:hypothetical protein FQN50_006887 [Emmonsiellopsis sp. PD_5]
MLLRSNLRLTRVNPSSYSCLRTISTSLSRHPAAISPTTTSTAITTVTTPAPRPQPTTTTTITSHTIHHQKLQFHMASRQITPGLEWEDEEEGPPFASIATAIRPDPLQKHKTWGFVVYRCSYSDEEAWQQMLELIKGHVVTYLEGEGMEDLWLSHELVIREDRERFDGASPAVVRADFERWVKGEMEKLPKSLEEAAERREQEEEEEEEDEDEDEDGEGGADNSNKSYEELKTQIASATRYNFCVFVDDICLESQEHMTEPVIKILKRDWEPTTPEPVEEEEEEEGKERSQQQRLHLDWEDGKTENEKEDVGWMYIPVLSTVGHYDILHDPAKWKENYYRPPGNYCLSLDEIPGFWRKGKKDQPA